MSDDRQVLTEAERAALRREVTAQLLDDMFGDGLEREYVTGGFSFKGVNNMTDEELLDELGHYDAEACGGSLDKKAAAWRAELAG